MPSSAAVHDQLVRIIVQVVGCEPAAVVQSARLKEDLGVDSLSIVEVAEKLGVTFGVYIADDEVNALRTVQDGIDAVVHPRAKAPSRRAVDRAAAAAAATLGPALLPDPNLPAAELRRRKSVAVKLAGGFAVVGLALGLVLGLGGTALIDASGMKGAQRPQVAAPTATTKAPKPTPTPTPTAAPTSRFAPPSLEAANTSISPGEKLRLTGAFPELGEGAEVQVQVKDAGSDWDDFPVVARTRGGGEFSTYIFTTRTGERQFRLLAKEAKTATPAVTITIG